MGKECPNCGALVDKHASVCTNCESFIPMKKKDEYMNRIGFIPMREGSKRVPNKNFKMIAGKRLYQWVTEAAIRSDLDHVYIYTDYDKLRNYAYWMYRGTKKLHLPQRRKRNATDTASTEQAMRDFVDDHIRNYDEIYLLQATSPMTTKEDINRAIRTMKRGLYDSVVSVVKQKRFIWSKDGVAQNYDPQKRPISQEYEGFWVENGAIYGTTKQQFEDSVCRVGGTIGLVEMPENTYIEIDTKDDFAMVESLLERRKNE